MKFRRMICLILCCAFLLGLLSACSGANSTHGSASIEVPGTSLPVPTYQRTDESTPSIAPSHETESTTEPEPEESVDPSSTLLPDLEAFLYHSASTSKKYGDYGYQLQWNGSHPYAAYETVQQELLDLLAEERYQLELRECVLNPHYAIPVYDYYYDYTGTSGEITKLIDKYKEHEFDVLLSFYVYPDAGYFQVVLKFSRAFDLEDSGKHTTRNMDHNSDGGVLTAPPEDSSDDSDFWEKCSACHGSGDCTHCGGDGEVKKFQAGLGWVEQDCTLCNRGKCRYCNGTGKD